MARFMHEATVEADPLRRLCVLLLARTASELHEEPPGLLPGGE